MLFIFIPFLVSAQTPPSVYINEIAWMGGPAPSIDSKQQWRHEWIELFNLGEDQSLSGWGIELSRDELDYRIPLEGIIRADEYFVVAASGKIEGYDLNYSNLGGKFFNGGQRIVLKDSNGKVIDEIDAREGWFAGKNDSKKTMEKRDSLRESNDKASWGNSGFVGGSPGKENSIAGREFGEVVSVFQTESKKESYDSFSGNTGVLAIAGVVALGSLLSVLVLQKRFLA